MFGEKSVPLTIVAQARGPRFGKVMALALVLAGVAVVAGRLGFGFDLTPKIPNPFPSQTVDRTGPALLKSLQDVSRYEAATGNYQVIVDTEKDTKYVPAIVKGERTVYAAAGSVDATVDFSTLDERAIAVTPDRLSVTVTLPTPELSTPHLDPEQSRVVSRQRGLLDRIGAVFSDTPTSERPLMIAAEQKMATAAVDSDLRARAETNTRAMLQNLLRALGYSTVTVNFTAPAAPAPG